MKRFSRIVLVRFQNVNKLGRYDTLLRSDFIGPKIIHDRYQKIKNVTGTVPVPILKMLI